jgi:ADP-ribose pyrophosphatase YjhB (NUDIX family)
MAEQDVVTHVVSCFLLRRDADGDSILLVQRSQRVRTYKGAWAAVSGYLEPGVTPLEQAYTEIREETALERDDVRLLKAGSPVEVRDAGEGLHWVVHPFLFAVERPERIRTDWEAAGSQWTSPDAVAQLRTVPKLAEALAAVYPGGAANAGA